MTFGCISAPRYNRQVIRYLEDYLLVGRDQPTPLCPKPLGDFWERQIRVLGPHLLSAFIKEPDITGYRCFGPIRKNLLPFLSFGPASLPWLYMWEIDNTIISIIIMKAVVPPLCLYLLLWHNGVNIIQSNTKIKLDLFTKRE